MKVWGTPITTPVMRTGWMVMAAEGTIKLRLAATARGTPMEWPPPSTTEAVGFDMPEISSAMARPASISPPTVFKSTKRASTSSASSTAAIAAILREEWGGDKSKQAFLDALDGWNRHIPKGFLKGFLDLVFRKDGYHYVVDWKSNSLTRQVSDFTEAGITAEMATAGYFFQYLMYSAVLHRFLKETMGSKYSWERNFGGVRYYFLRGIPSNGEQSIFSDRPSETLLEKLCTALGLEG